MNILTLLKKDHEVVQHLLAELHESSNKAIKTRRKLLETLKQELTLHEEIEETIFYPPLKHHSKTKDLILESYEEHHVVDLILAELDDLETNDERWKAKLSVLKENITHHIREEEKELFPKVKEVLNHDDLEKMGHEMQQKKASHGS
jgi:iron-sulfur cluster repair protein YtfE (RIC family)